MTTRRKELWYDIADREAAGVSLIALSNKYKDQFSSRKVRAVNLLSIYEGLSLGSFSANAYDQAEPLEFIDDVEGKPGARSEAVWNLGASILDSIDAKLFALDKIKTAFVVTDGSYDLKRAAVLAGRFVDGQMHEPQGIFPNLWALWRHAGRLALTCTGTAAVFYWSDPDEGKIVAELDDTLNMFVETSGLPYDGITSIGRVSHWDPEKLAARFPGNEADIYAASERPMSDLQLATTEADAGPDEVRRVPLVQGWRMQAPGVKGRYCYAIPGKTLDEGPYEYAEPPCVFFTPYRQLAGFWGRPQLERIVKPLQRMNEILTAIDDAERLTPKGVLWYDPTATSPAQLATIKNVVHIPTTDLMKKGTYEPPPPIHPIVLDIFNLHKQACFDLVGMSEAQATASREKGLSSGVAIRLVQNQTYERFSPVEEEFTRCVGPDSAKQIMRCAREIHQSKSGGFKAAWKGSGERGFLREIDAGVFDTLEKEGKFRVEPEAVSGQANTPADRVELAEELMQAGIITGEAYHGILQHFDTPGSSGGHLELEKAEEEFVTDSIDSWLYDTLEDAKKYYLGPEKWMSSEKLVLKVGASYLQARRAMRRDESPEAQERLRFFLQFLSQLDADITEKARRALEAQGAAQPQPMAPPMAPAAPQMVPPAAPPMAAA